MRILIFNWKDIKHPSRGGAEVLTHELAKRFVKKGHQVTMFVTSFAGSQHKEIIDGVVIVRSRHIGLALPYNPTHFIRSFLFYMFSMRRKVDVVIDELHGIPFFTPLYVRQRIFFLVCEVAQNIWDSMFPFPVNQIGKLFERFYFSLYKKVSFLTISPSTKQDLLKLGIQENNITVLPMGITTVQAVKYVKEKDPTFIFVGRMNKMKGVVDCLRAFAQFAVKHKNAKLWLVGGGEESFVSSLRKLSQKLGIAKYVVFFGFVDDKTKYALMAKAHAIIVPSVREGFGLIVPEAGSVATPSIVYDVAGLRDVVVEGKNGLITKTNSPDGLADAMYALFQNQNYKRMCALAKKESSNYNWDNTARVALKKITSR